MDSGGGLLGKKDFNHFFLVIAYFFRIWTLNKHFAINIRKSIEQSCPIFSTPIWLIYVWRKLLRREFPPWDPLYRTHNIQILKTTPRPGKLFLYQTMTSSELQNTRPYQDDHPKEFQNFPSLYGLILNRSYWLLLYKKNGTRRNEVWKYLIWKFQLLKVTPCPSQTVWETELRLLLKIIIDLSDGDQWQRMSWNFLSQDEGPTDDFVNLTPPPDCLSSWWRVP